MYTTLTNTKFNFTFKNNMCTALKTMSSYWYTDIIYKKSLT